MAYNGGSIGGVVFSPLWVAAIDRLGFPVATMVIGSVMAAVMWVLAEELLSRTPQQMSLAPDGNAPAARAMCRTRAAANAHPGSLQCSDIAFRTLAAGIVLGMFSHMCL